MISGPGRVFYRHLNSSVKQALSLSRGIKMMESDRRSQDICTPVKQTLRQAPGYSSSYPPIVSSSYQPEEHTKFSPCCGTPSASPASVNSSFESSPSPGHSGGKRPWRPSRESKHRKSPAFNHATPEKDQVWAKELLERSRTYTHKFVDSHCHIDLIYDRLRLCGNTPYAEFRGQRDHSYPVNYEGCVAIFCNPQTFDLHYPDTEVLDTVSKEQGVWLALGCHPKNAAFFTSSSLEGLKKMLLSYPNVVALGEVGLDYSGEFHKLADVQREVLVSQLEMAVELNLPLVIHCRDADDELLELLKKHVPSSHKIHRHCFTQDLATAQRWADAFPNMFFGFTPVITYRSAQDPAHAASQLPLERLLLETDAPYFVPGNIKSRHLKVTHPGFALFTAEKIAELRGIPVDEVLEACRNNTSRMYGV